MEGDDRPLVGGDSDTLEGVGGIHLSMKNFSFERCPLLLANMCPKLRKSFSTSIMKPTSMEVFKERTFKRTIVRVQTNLT